MRLCGTLVQIYVGSTRINNKFLSLEKRSFVGKIHAISFVFLTIKQFYNTFGDFFISVVVFTCFLKTKRKNLRCCM